MLRRVRRPGREYIVSGGKRERAKELTMGSREDMYELV